MDIGARLDFKFWRGRSYNLKKFVKMEEEELAKRIHALDDLDEDVSTEDDNDFEDGASDLSLEF